MSKPLIPAQRRDRIREHLAIHKIVRIADLSEMLNASEATIRRDLERLEDKGIVERTHGGAILSQRLNLEQEYQQRTLRSPDEKRSIGAIAASLIEEGDNVFINSGTTTTQVIRHIRGNADITVITNNLNAALEMGTVDFELVLLGGSYQPKSISVAGRFAVNNLSQIYANKAFIGVDGFSLKYGFTVPSSPEAEIIRRMLKRTRGKIYVVADHRKWGVVSNFEIAAIDQIHHIITDDGFDSDARDSLAEYSVNIIIASVDPGLKESKRANR